MPPRPTNGVPLLSNALLEGNSQSICEADGKANDDLRIESCCANDGVVRPFHALAVFDTILRKLNNVFGNQVRVWLLHAFEPSLAHDEPAAAWCVVWLECVVQPGLGFG